MARTHTRISNGNSALDPMSYQNIVGSTFAKHDHRPLIVIGNRQWTRWQLGRLGCPHPAAAVRVNRIIKTMGIKTTRDFVQHALEFTSYKDIGVTCYWVVLALLHDLGANIDAIHDKVPSFSTMHRHALRDPEEKGLTA